MFEGLLFARCTFEADLTELLLALFLQDLPALISARYDDVAGVVADLTSGKLNIGEGASRASVSLAAQQHGWHPCYMESAAGCECSASIAVMNGS